jgi:hypothetical protein
MRITGPSASAWTAQGKFSVRTQNVRVTGLTRRRKKIQYPVEKDPSAGAHRQGRSSSKNKSKGRAEQTGIGRSEVYFRGKEDRTHPPAQWDPKQLHTRKGDVLCEKAKPEHPVCERNEFTRQKCHAFLAMRHLTGVAHGSALFSEHAWPKFIFKICDRSLVTDEKPGEKARGSDGSV